jgi:N6-adenosine-specific RNA methylase IME4
MRRLRPEKVDEFAESIRARGGLLQPIIVRPGRRDRYTLVAGRHRYEAAKQIGSATIAAIVCDGLDADAALLAEIDENLIRAELSAAERALHLAERKRLYEKVHPQTKHGGDRRSKSSSRNENLKSFTADAAAKTGKGRSTIAREIARGKIADLADVIGTSLDAPDQLDALAKLPEVAQRDLIARAASGEKVKADHAARRLRREQRERELAKQIRALPDKRYGVIYADPPWKFEPYADSWDERLADNHYPCMPTVQIKALTIPAAKDCALFLWATVPMLDQVIEVMRAWGFAYKSLIVWVKDRTGTGYWTLNKVELLLIGTRGNVPAPNPGEQPPQVVEAPRGRHSEKPATFAEIIENLYPSVPKLEMFARTARPGWDIWGNEAPMAEAAA